MKTKIAVSLCALVLSIASCKNDAISTVTSFITSDPEFSDVRLISNLTEKLKCAASYPLFSYDSFDRISSTTKVDDVYLSKSFEFEGVKHEISLDYDSKNNIIRTIIENNTIRHDIGDNDIIIWDGVFNAGHYDRNREISQIPHTLETAQRLLRIYEAFIPEAFQFASEICSKNPYVYVSYADFETRIKQKSKPKIILVTAEWCGPCYRFKEGDLRRFLKEYNDQIDVITVNAGGDKPLSSDEQWMDFLEDRYRIDIKGFPSVLFLDKDNNLKGLTDSEDYHFNYTARKALGLEKTY